MTTLEHRELAANDVQFDQLRQQLEAARAQATAQELTQLSQQAGRIADKNQTIAQRRQATIDANEAQLARLSLADQVDFATLTLQLSQPSVVRKTTVLDVETVFDTHRPGFFNRAAHALRDGWNGLKSFVIDLLSAWPVLAGIAAAVLLWRGTRLGQVVRGWLRRQPRPTPVTTAAATTVTAPKAAEAQQSVTHSPHPAPSAVV
jgi:Domain of unknown function (DUF4349)